jgi:hypothetical protein
MSRNAVDSTGFNERTVEAISFATVIRHCMNKHDSASFLTYIIRYTSKIAIYYQNFLTYNYIYNYVSWTEQSVQ